MNMDMCSMRPGNARARPRCSAARVAPRRANLAPTPAPVATKADRAGVPDLSVSGDNSDLVEVDPHDLTTMSEPEAPMQSLNQLPMVTDLADERSA
jgi:hypothetical protein